MIATTTNLSDDPIADLARREDVRCFRGSEHDVLSRYVGAIEETSADVIVRITADCPLIDSCVTDRVIDGLISGPSHYDYASNVHERTFPRGLDTEALFRDTLLRLDRMSTTAASREHVTVFLRSERPDLFQVLSIVDTEDNSDLRWTVDTAADLEMARKVYSALDLGSRVAGYREILAYVRASPEMQSLNSDVQTRNPA